MVRFPRYARLTRPKQFESVFRGAFKSSSGYVTILARPNRLDYPRLGMAISRKCARSAVQRNRVKRLVRESFRYHQHQLGGVDIVVLSHRGVDKQENRCLTEALARHWIKLRERWPGS